MSGQFTRGDIVEVLAHGAMQGEVGEVLGVDSAGVGVRVRFADRAIGTYLPRELKGIAADAHRRRTTWKLSP